MCGRYVLPDDDAIRATWSILREPSAETPPLPRFNVAPTTPVPILVPTADGALRLQTARWGLIPRWWQKDAPPALTFNARSEEAARKPTWRDALLATRCLMPARGWYEWNENQPARAPDGRPTHQPYYLYCPALPILAFAGLWAIWERPGADPVISCALLSAAAAPAIAHIHHRMPIVLKPEHHRAWLDPKATPEQIQALLSDPLADLQGHPVSTRVNSVRNDSPDLLQRIPLYHVPDLFSSTPPP
jgi:putative SOS response-associated peptidase YedK